MSKELEITKDITVAWLNAYKTDLSIRRQKGVVPLFTPTNEEVLNFITETYKRIVDLSEGNEIPVCESNQDGDACVQKRIELPLGSLLQTKKEALASLPKIDLSSLPKADLSSISKAEIKLPLADSSVVTTMPGEEPAKKSAKAKNKKKAE